MKTGVSGDNWKSDDPLPEGWTVQVKVRSNGKKDKCYFPPSGEGKFYSKLEVVRYLNNSNPKSEEKEKGIDQHNENVVVEKAEPKGLPPGWTKEIKVTKKAHKIRRDSYYTDPASGYVFRSMKDVLRYLETGEVGKQAFKPKDKGNNDVELEDDKACSPAAAKKQKLAVNGTRSPTISEKSSKPFEVAKDEQVLSSANTGESLPVSEHNVVGAQSNSSEVPEGKGSNQTVGKSDPATSVIATAVDILPNEPPVESRVMKDEIRSTPQKCKKKKNLNLPRRASKRLAGLPLDPTPELKTTNRARQAPVKQSDDIVVSTGGGNLVETENEDSKKCEHAVLSGGRNLAIGEEHPGMIITDNNADEKPGLPIDLPLGELWQDPCIAFAIKILTGISFDNSGSVQVSSGSNNSEFGSSTALEDHARKEEDHRKQGCTVHQPLVNIVTSEERPRGIDIGDKSDEKPGSPLSFADAWADPCIEFAIKTLTDAIPLDYDMVIQDCLPQKASSSQSQESSGLTLQNVGEPGQTEFFYRQFGISEKPSYNQGALMEPALPHAKNVNLGYSGGAIHHQLSEDRSKEYKR
ncbi:hypothetical protein GH714_027313 [Hevea brasiliensis]|uniref:MBD domain-containing protein n=1 Tax=Hevea brasiliensis TaxID=3981 RepID=A0A6A6N3Y8_HEVBR|nr:hypothetical protein GH714_027313 [Hevea brasiliensis]